MERATAKELRELVEHLNRLSSGGYTIEWAYGKPRLHQNNGSTDVSPRLPKGEMREWLFAYIAGYMAGYSARA